MSDIKEMKDRMKKSVEFLKEDLNSVRAGRANPAILDKITVDYYGTPSPLKTIANISVPEPRQLLITPFDPSSIQDIEKAIQASDIGINPSNDGKCIRLVIPQLTEERRRDLTKQIKARGEDAKIAIRNIRRDENDMIKKEEKNGDMSEDDMRAIMEDVEKTTDKAIKEIDEIVKVKEKEVMEV